MTGPRAQGDVAPIPGIAWAQVRSVLLAYWRAVGVRPLAELTLAGSKAPRLPYALPIAVGALATLWWQ